MEVDWGLAHRPFADYSIARLVVNVTVSIQNLDASTYNLQPITFMKHNVLNQALTTNL